MRLKRRSSGDIDAAALVVADARMLALEYAGLRSAMAIDAHLLGVALRPDETIRRVAATWFRVRLDGQWSEASPSQVMITDRRLILRLGSGELASLWWGSLIGFEADLDAGHVVLDFGDGRPRLFSGEASSLVAVAAVAQIYGVTALATHPCLEPLRAR
ncbi:hypothetical protein [Pedococcus sp. 5OH_020]|uniref:hypothetical protein n=1 Tax=Pedococcus sp. 5OH_020 TaxID=2989814 RepID=UPI0022E9EC32|nr:hypothetical protein [Pedococcus sp. 5OH_020]